MTDLATGIPRTAFAGAQRIAGYREQATPPPHADDRQPGQPRALPPAEKTAVQPDPDKRSIFPAPSAPRPITPPPVAQPRPVATLGWRGRLARGGIKLSPSAAETTQLARCEAVRRDETTVRQATWNRAVSVLVANPKGGTGKTPVSLLLGGTFAAIRGGSVAVLEVADDPGALTYRAEGRPTFGLGELIRDLPDVRTAGQLAGYTAPQTSFASIIGTVGARPRLTDTDVTAVAGLLDSFYTVRVMDSGNQPSSPAFFGALQVTDALVVPVLNAGDSVREAVGLICGLRATGWTRLADTAIILRLTDGRPEDPQATAELDYMLGEAHAAAILDVPYDPHIANRAELTLAHLAPATYQAFVALAATVTRTLQDIGQ